MPVRQRAVLALVIGMIINIALAWACALWSSVDHALPSKPVDVAAIIVADAPRQEFEVVRAGVGHREYGSTTIVVADASNGEFWLMQSPIAVLIEARSGWPCLCLSRSASWRSVETNWLNHGVAIADERLGAIDGRRIPLRPIWDGLAFNSLLFWAISFGVLSAPGKIRSRWRRTRGRCSDCGYALIVSERCPECGRANEMRAIGESLTMPYNRGQLRQS